MRNDLAIDHSDERYVVEVDGIAKAEYPIFVKALKASLKLRQELPNCRVNCVTLATRPRTKLRRCYLPLVKRYLSTTVLELLA
jgi:hypothetical protein